MSNFFFRKYINDIIAVDNKFRELKNMNVIILQTIILFLCLGITNACFVIDKNHNHILIIIT